MAAIATGIDFDTLGAITSTGAQMRARQPDQAGGTDSTDAYIAWRSYGRLLTIRDGLTFADVIADLRAGRLVHLDVWHASAGGPCMSGTGRYGHTLAVAPEHSTIGDRWLTADPWCLPARWQLWPTSRLRAGAQDWGARVSMVGLDSGGPDAARALMSRYKPGDESTDTETGGFADSGPVLYTVTSGGTGDMAIQGTGGLTSGYHIDLPADTQVYYDANLTEPMTRKTGTHVYIGLPLRETVAGGSRAVLVNTRQPYSDGVARLTVGYIPHAVAQPYGVPTPLPPDVTEAIAKRDAEWRTWLLAGNPGDGP
jgi:hypothetical protein